VFSFSDSVFIQWRCFHSVTVFSFIDFVFSFSDIVFIHWQWFYSVALCFLQWHCLHSVPVFSFSDSGFIQLQHSHAVNDFFHSVPLCFHSMTMFSFIDSIFIQQQSYSVTVFFIQWSVLIWYVINTAFNNISVIYWWRKP